jgi:hypothetical protein
VSRQTDRAAGKRDARHKDVVSGPSYAINGEAIAIPATTAEGDFEAPFLVDVSVGHGKGRLTVPALLDTGCRLSAVVDYQLAEQLCERLQISLVDLAKPIPISDFAGEVHQAISQALHVPIRVNEHQQGSQIFYVTKAAYPMILGKKWMRLHGCMPNPIDSSVWFNRSCGCKEQSTGRRTRRLKSASVPQDAQTWQENSPEEMPTEKPLQITEILRRPKIAQTAPELRRPVKVRKLIRSRAAAVINQRRTSRKRKASMNWTEPVSILTFKQLSAIPGAEMFAITIEDINEHIQKQTTAEPDSAEVLPMEFRQFADVFSKKASDTLPEHREEYDHHIKLENGAKLPRTQPLRRMSPDEL